jgi:hypothetical protein
LPVIRDGSPGERAVPGHFCPISASLGPEKPFNPAVSR